MLQMDASSRTLALKERLLSKRKRDGVDDESDAEPSVIATGGGLTRKLRNRQLPRPEGGGNTSDSDSDDDDDNGVRLDPDNPDSFPGLDEQEDLANKSRKKKRKTKLSTHQERRKSKKPKDIDDDDLDEKLGINRRISSLSPGMMVDWVARRIERFGNGQVKGKGNGAELTGLEMMDMRIDESCVVDTASPEWQFRDRITDSLPSFLQTFVPGGNKQLRAGVPAEQPGSPHTLVIAMAGMRAADLSRVLREPFGYRGGGGGGKKSDGKSDADGPGGVVAKLFAKHIKLQEAIETCSKTRMTMGVGTSQRILDLLEARVPLAPRTSSTQPSSKHKNDRKSKKSKDKLTSQPSSDEKSHQVQDEDQDESAQATRPALSTQNLRTLVVDASHIDAKKRGILDTPEAVVPLVKLIVRLTKEVEEEHGRKLNVVFY